MVICGNHMILQPTHSSLCGHCCLATILDITLDDAIKLIGHRRGTKSRELIKHFNHQSIIVGKPKYYSLCKVRPTNAKRVGKWYWVLYIESDVIYDPCIGILLDYNSWRLAYQLEISSYIRIHSRLSADELPR